MLHELKAWSKKMGLKISASKKTVMGNSGRSKVNLQVDVVDLEEVEGYVYLGQEVNMHHSLQPEITPRGAAEWC